MKKFKKFSIASMFLFSIAFSFVSFSQTKEPKNVIILNNDKLAMGFSSIEINGIKQSTKFKNYLVSQYTNDSIEVKVPSSVLLFITLKKETFRFAIKDKDNYFLYKGPSLTNKLSLQQVTGDDLVKLKKEKYVKEILKKFNLE